MHTAADMNSVTEIILKHDDTVYTPTSIFVAGDRLYIEAVIYQRRAVFMYHPSTGTLRRILNTFDSYFEPKPYLSTDKIVYFRQIQSETVVYIYHPDSDSQEVVLAIPSLWKTHIGDYQWTITEGHIFFVSEFDDYGYEIRCYDRQQKQSFLLKDIDPNYGKYSTGPQYLYTHDNTLFFSAFDGNTYSVWTSDGTTSGTKNIGSFVEVNDPNYQPTDFMVFKDRFFFIQDCWINGDYYGREYHYYDLKTQQNGQLLDLKLNSFGAGIWGSNYTVLNDSQFAFTVSDVVNSSEFWISDGTPDGTYKWFSLSELGFTVDQLYFYLKPVRRGWLVGSHSRNVWINPKKGLVYPISYFDHSPFDLAFTASALPEAVYLANNTTDLKNGLYRLSPASLGAREVYYLCGNHDSILIETGLDTNQIKHRWMDGSTKNSIEIADTGWYWVEFRDPQVDTLFTRDSLRVNWDSYSSFTLGKVTGVHFPFVLEPNFNGEYSWQDGSKGASFTAQEPGTYWVDYLAPSGCLVRDSIMLSFPLNLDQQEMQMSVFPNPGSGVLHIRLDENPGTVKLVVYDAQGKQVQSLIASGEQIDWPLNLNPGIYWLQVEYNKGIYRTKLSRLP